MSHQWISIVPLFFLSTVAFEMCIFKKFSPVHSGCKERNENCGIVNYNMTNEDRTMIVKLHNQFRELTATAGENDPQADTSSNMRELEWYGELEYVAQRHAETCKGGHDCDQCRRVEKFEVVGQTIYKDYLKKDKNVWEEMMEELRCNSYIYQLQWAETWAIGCGKVEIEDGSGERIASIVCNYGPGNTTGPPSIPGEPCSNCPSGTCCRNHCSVGSAFHTYYPSLCRVDKCKYKKFSSNHIGCKPKNPACKTASNKVTRRERIMILHQLNEFRDNVSLGIEYFGQFVRWGKQSEPRGDMRELEWDSELARLAQRHAETCNIVKDCDECRKVERFDVGQIVFTSRDDHLKTVLQSLVEEFHKKEEYYNQITWPSTWRVGCGKVEPINHRIFGWKMMIVCNFGPDGDIHAAISTNTDEQTPETRTKPKANLRPCTDCPRGTCCGAQCVAFGVHSEYKGLCKSKIKEDASSPRRGVGACKYYKFSLDHIGCKWRNPDCPIIRDKITKEERIMILQQLNEFRDNVALGEAGFAKHKPYGEEMKSAANMRELEWDSELAMLAQRHAETCNETEDALERRRVDRFEVGQMIKVTENFDFPTAWESFMENRFINQIIWASTWKVGCGKVQVKPGSFDWDMMIVCNFGPAGNNKVLTFNHEEGTPYLVTHTDIVPKMPKYICSKCPKGTCCGQYGKPLCEKVGIETAYKALCKSVEKEALGTSVEDMKKCEYEKFSPEHVGCQPRNDTCNIIDDRLTEAQKRKIVEVHNDYRNNVAMGRINIEEGGWQTYAANMRQMVWDNELAQLAQIQAETCTHIYDDCPECRKVDQFDYVGQIRYESASTDFKSVVESMPKKLKNQEVAQLHWADTWKVGCGKIVYEEDGGTINSKMLIICNYGPGAKDITDENTYKHGGTCTDCPWGTCCGESCEQHEVHADYEGLCKLNLVDTPGSDIESNLVDTPGSDIELDECGYSKFNLNHASCKTRNLSCEIIENNMKSSDQEEILQLLNDFRNRIALERDYDYDLRAAANMWEMEWDEELAYIAQKHAETCNAEYDCRECRKVDRFDVNQIIYKTHYTEDENEVWKNMIEAFLQNTDHLLQVVSANSWRIGCGKVVFVEGTENQILVVCNFGPDLIFKWKVNFEPYIYGVACTACPSGTCCGAECNAHKVETNYEGLCKSLSDSKWSEPETEFEIQCVFYAPEGSISNSIAEISGGSDCRLAIVEETPLFGFNITGTENIKCGSYRNDSDTDNSLECRLPSVVDTSSAITIADYAKADFEYLMCALKRIVKVTEKPEVVGCPIKEGET